MKREDKASLAVLVLVVPLIIGFGAWTWRWALTPLRQPTAVPLTFQVNFSNMSDAQAMRLLDATLKEFDKRGILPPPDFDKEARVKRGKM